MKWIIPFITASMGWTDDADTEGLVEENPLVFIIIGVVGATVATLLYVYGIEYNPGWFEGQNLVSTLGIIFLLIFIPAIAISTATGKSNLVKWEALFLLISVGMILVGNGLDFKKFLEAFDSSISFLGNSTVSQILTAMLIIMLLAIAVAIGTGHRVGAGAAAVIFVLLLAIGVINLWNSGTLGNIGNYIRERGFWYAFGKALSDFTGGLAAGKAGAAIGAGCLIIGILMVIIPNWSTPIGIILIIIGAGILGTALWEQFWNPLFNKAAEGDPAALATSVLIFGVPGIGLPFVWAKMR